MWLRGNSPKYQRPLHIWQQPTAPIAFLPVILLRAGGGQACREPTLWHRWNTLVSWAKEATHPPIPHPHPHPHPWRAAPSCFPFPQPSARPRNCPLFGAQAYSLKNHPPSISPQAPRQTPPTGSLGGLPGQTELVLSLQALRVWNYALTLLSMDSLLNISCVPLWDCCNNNNEC